MFDRTAMNGLPPYPGVGYKPQHFSNILAETFPVGWLEIHAENYMGAGGRPIAQLRALAERFPLSVHGVGLSIGGEGPLDRDHLGRLRHLCGWLKPASFSEHLAWSTHDAAFLNDLLPLPYTEATLARVAEHIDEVQEALGRRMLLENPSVYLDFAETSIAEIDFLTEVAARTGCGLLLDVNNVFVSSSNHGHDPRAYVAALPLDRVVQFHVAGHTDLGTHILDTHIGPVRDPVWRLFGEAHRLIGGASTLLEWDAEIPSFEVTHQEALRALEFTREAA